MGTITHWATKTTAATCVSLPCRALTCIATMGIAGAFARWNSATATTSTSTSRVSRRRPRSARRSRPSSRSSAGRMIAQDAAARMDTTRIAANTDGTPSQRTRMRACPTSPTTPSVPACEPATSGIEPNASYRQP